MFLIVFVGICSFCVVSGLLAYLFVVFCACLFGLFCFLGKFDLLCCFVLRGFV